MLHVAIWKVPQHGKPGPVKIFSKNRAIGVGLRLLVSIAATQLSILIAFNLFNVTNWMPPITP